MAHKVEFLKSTTINGVKYEAGKKLNVSTSIYNRLIKAELAKDFVAKKEIKKDSELAPKKPEQKPEQKPSEEEKAE
jgi:hypothetical protein